MLFAIPLRITELAGDSPRLEDRLTDTNISRSFVPVAGL